VAGCSQPSETAPPDYATDLTRSRVCSFTAVRNIAGEVTRRPSQVTMNNDGGWCWQLMYTNTGARVAGVPMHLTEQPSHGEVKLKIFEKATRIAYKPKADFIGTDEFSVMNELYNIDQPYIVTVQHASAPGMAVRSVHAGVQSQIGSYTYLNADCSFGGYADVKVQLPPHHGALAIGPDEGYSNYPASNQRYDCNKRKSQRIAIKYTPAPGFTGTDEFVLFSLWPNSTSVTDRYDVTVVP
jgi:hypothetical protein